MAKQLIKDFYGRVIGSIDDRGDKQIGKDFYGKVVGTYYPSSNLTKDFYGKIVGKGNLLSGLIMSAKK